MNWENQSKAERASGMDAALAAEKTQIPPVRSEPMLAAEFGQRADAAYERYVEMHRRPECQGAEAKMKSGKFGMRELESHRAAMEAHGMYMAYVRCRQRIFAANAHPHGTAAPAGTVQGDVGFRKED